MRQLRDCLWTEPRPALSSMRAARLLPATGSAHVNMAPDRKWGPPANDFFHELVTKHKTSRPSPEPVLRTRCYDCLLRRNKMNFPKARPCPSGQRVLQEEEGVFQSSSVSQSCPTLWEPMDCSMPSLPVLHQLPELTQTHVS